MMMTVASPHNHDGAMINQHGVGGQFAEVQKCSGHGLGAAVQEEGKRWILTELGAVHVTPPPPNCAVCWYTIGVCRCQPNSREIHQSLSTCVSAKSVLPLEILDDHVCASHNTGKDPIPRVQRTTLEKRKWMFSLPHIYIISE
jgi:hypothetical protein